MHEADEIPQLPRVTPYSLVPPVFGIAPCILPGDLGEDWGKVDFPEVRTQFECQGVIQSYQELAEALEKATGQVSRLKGLMAELLDEVYVPESNCSCHIAPPCNDCVENAGLREIVGTCKRAIQ